ncbi:hypothetical protein [Haloferula sp. A504]
MPHPGPSTSRRQFPKQSKVTISAKGQELRFKACREGWPLVG